MVPVFTFQFHITDACDQRCRHCYIFAEGACNLATMPYEQVEQVIDSACEMCARGNSRPYFYITGGDPILHPDFWRIAELLHSRDVMWCVMGNPFHLTAEVCARLESLGCRKYQLSLDGLRQTHDAFRKPGSFDATLAAIPLIKGAGMWSTIMSTVSSANASELPALIDLVANLGVDVFAFGRYCPTSGQRRDEFHMEPLEYREVLLACQERIDSQKATGCPTTFQLKDHLWKLLLWEQGKFEIPADAVPGRIYNGCHCGIAHITITPTGDVFACRRMESRVGNALETPLEQIFYSPQMDAYRDFTRFEKCSRCKLMGFCRGCPSVSAGYTGNMYAPDPQCWASEEMGLLAPLS